jgi:hypothetical protein
MLHVFGSIILATALRARSALVVRYVRLLPRAALLAAVIVVELRGGRIG